MPIARYVIERRAVLAGRTPVHYFAGFPFMGGERWDDDPNAVESLTFRAAHDIVKKLRKSAKRRNSWHLFYAVKNLDEIHQLNHDELVRFAEMAHRGRARKDEPSSTATDV